MVDWSHQLHSFCAISLPNLLYYYKSKRMAQYCRELATRVALAFLKIVGYKDQETHGSLIWFSLLFMHCCKSFKKPIFLKLKSTFRFSLKIEINSTNILYKRTHTQCLKFCFTSIAPIVVMEIYLSFLYYFHYVAAWSSSVLYSQEHDFLLTYHY